MLRFVMQMILSIFIANTSFGIKNIIVRNKYKMFRFQTKKTLQSNAIWAVIAVLINTIINFTIVPYVTERIGTEAYGFVSLVNTFVTYIDVVTVALNAFASRFVAIEFHKSNIEKAKEYYSSVFFANVIIAVLLLFCSIITIPNLNAIISIPVELENDVKILFAVVAIRYCIVLLRTVFEINAFITNRLDIIEKNRALSYFIQAFVLIITCGFLVPKVWFVGVATLAAATSMFIIQLYYSKKLASNLVIRLRYFECNIIKEVLSAGIWNSINNLGNILNSGLDLLVANKMLTSLLMGMVSISKTVGSLCYMVASAISNSFKPKQLQKYSVGDIQGLIDELKKSMKVTGMVCAVLISGFYSCGYDFLHLWLPSQNHLLLFRLTMIVLISDVMIGVVNPLYYVFTLTKKLRVPCVITILMGLTNISSMYLLIKYTEYRMYAVVLTTMVINFIHFFDTPLYSAYCLRLSWKTFYPIILRHLLNCAVLTCILTMMNNWFPIVNRWGTFIIKVCIYGVIAIIFGILIVDHTLLKRIVKVVSSRRE